MPNESTFCSSPSAATSRRSFLRLAGLAASLPVFTEGRLAWAAMAEAAPGAPLDPSKAVMINANENPLGPCDAALNAIRAAAATGGRYDAGNAIPELYSVFSKQLGVPENYITIYGGSSDPLQFAVAAFTSKEKPLIVADPTYEAGYWGATAIGHPFFKVPLTSTYAHDTRAMVAASPNAGLIYICNPNNPTGTLTPKADILYALQNKPKGSILLIDEAYIHLSEATNCLDLVQAHQDVIILRTFSKVYGMAGIRCGAAIGRPDLLAKLKSYGGENPLPITGVTAAIASLKDKDLVPTRRKIIADTRNQTFAWLTAKGYTFIPSVSNCFMIDTGRPGKDVIKAMADRNVMIGRTWPVWPNHVRISVGTPAEMAAFQIAFADVMSTPA
jgi:histidinol-phosphate aminotransferase